MITVKLKNTYQIPSRWSDFQTEHYWKFVGLCDVIEKFETGLLTFDQFRLMTAFALMEIDPEKIRISPKRKDGLSENMFRITELLDFPYVLQDNEDGSRTAYIRISLFRNLIQTAHGYKLDVSPAGLVECTLTAEQYVDALTLTELYSQTRSEEALQKLCETLHGPACDLTRKEMVAAYYNFRGVIDWIHQLPQYSILFNRYSAKKSPESPLGLSSSIFALSKSGYGTLKEIKDLDVFTYLGALVQMSVESIRQLAAAGLKPVLIAEKLNLPVSEVLPHVTDNEDYEHTV